MADCYEPYVALVPAGGRLDLYYARLVYELLEATRPVNLAREHRVDTAMRRVARRAARRGRRRGEQVLVPGSRQWRSWQVSSSRQWVRGLSTGGVLVWVSRDV